MVPDLRNVARDAFGATPDPRFLYMSHTHREALDRLFHAIEGDRPFVVLTGEPGTGKTTLLFHLLEQYRKTAQTVFIFQSQCSARDLMRYVLADCDITNEGSDAPSMHEQFNELLVSTYRVGKRFLLLLDEAQNFPQETLEAVRLLSDFETPTKKLLQIVFSGQPSFETVLASPAMLQLRQRVAAYCSLEPLKREEAGEYIRHRLQVVGKPEELFSRASLRMISEVSRGIPREIHNICFESLCLAAERGTVGVDCEMVRESARRLRLAIPSESCLGEEWSASEEEKPTVAVAAATAAMPSPVATTDSAVTPVAVSSFQPVSPISEPAGESAAPQSKLTNSEEPRADSDLERFRYLFEPGADRPALYEQADGDSTKQRRGVLVGSVCALLLAALAVTVLKPDMAALKGKLLSVVEAREGIPPPEVQPVVTEVNVPQQAPAPVKRADKPIPAQESKPTQESNPLAVARVPQISSEPTGPHQSISEGHNEPAPTELSGIALPGEGKQTPPVVEPAANARLDIPKQQIEVVRPKLLVSPVPKYPDDARRAGIQGVVELEAVIDTNGKLKDVRVIQGHPMLIREALKAAEQQQYTPFLLNSVPHEVPTRIRFIFKP